MGNCCGVKSSPSRDELNPLEQKAHDGIEDGLISAYKNDNRVKKLLLLGAGSSGKSTIFRQLKCVYKSGFVESEMNEVIPIIRRNCVSGILTLLKKTQQLYEIDSSANTDCYIDIDTCDDSMIRWIKTVVNFSKETFEDYENSFLSYITNIDDDDVTIDDNTESRIHEKKNELSQLASAIKLLWNVPQVQATWRKRSAATYAFCFPDNMEHFFNKIDACFEWNYVPTSDDILKCRIRTTGLIHAFYEEKQIAFTITDVGGQRNERKKWIHGFEGVTAVIYVAALNHYGTVLFEDESKNAMVESIELFSETCNLKWFKKTEIILFLNKDDLFRENIENDIALSICFNSENACIYKKEYDNDCNYYPKEKNNKKNQKKNNMDVEDDNMSMINNNDDNEYSEEDICGYIPPKIDMINDNETYREKCAIYPKEELRFSCKDTYDGGRWMNESNDKWLDYIYNDYIHFITEQYLSKNHHPHLKRIFVHVTTATDPNNVKKVFWNVQNIIIRSNLKHGGLV